MVRIATGCVLTLVAACVVPSDDSYEHIGSTQESIILETPLWETHPSDLAAARFGDRLAGGLDVNGDGFDDVVVTAPLWDGQAENEGRAYAYFGSERGLPTTPSWVADPTNTLDAGFGEVAALGDVNADGYGDFALLSTTLGLTYVYLGSEIGPGSAAPSILTVGGATAISAAGDVNGDGFADMIVGAPGFAGQQVGEGRATILLGSAAGLTGQGFSLDPTDQLDAFFGAAVASAGDLNGDGFGDVAIGASGWDGEAADEGRVYVFFGSAEGPVEGWTVDPTNQTGSGFGRTVSGAGDINSDGFADLLVGAPGWSDTVAGRGRAYLFQGGLEAPTTSLTLSPVDQPAARFGFSLSGAGDVNGDGYGDIIVGSIGFDPNVQSVDAGEAVLYLGGSLGLDSEIGGISVPGVDAGALFGFVVANAGDVNGDGLADVMAGAPIADGGVLDEGKVFGFYGAVPARPEDFLPQRARAFQQASGEAGTVLLAGGIATGDVSLSAPVLQEGLVGGLVALEVELKDVALPFDALDLVTSEPVAAGDVAQVVFSDLVPGQYKWRARTIFPVGTGRGQWIEYADAAAIGPDFIVEEPEVIVPEKIGYYDCQIKPGDTGSRGATLVLALFVPLLLLLRRRRSSNAR